MNIDDFVTQIAEQFEETDTSGFNPDTNFKNNDEYSSLTGMSIIAMVDEKFRIKLTGNELRSVSTIENLFNLIKSKIFS